ncbi:GntR family transcriptional regulator [Synechococcus moorigangaii CMS01]|nr:GntR family transcriptional regulator [Synechococcus moorigangaii CMS01]
MLIGANAAQYQIKKGNVLTGGLPVLLEDDDLPKTQQADSGSEVGRRRLGSSQTTSLPVYHQLYTILRQQIQDGMFGRDQPLPPEMTLSKTYDVSRVTVRRALEMLERESLIVRRHGVGTFACPPGGEGGSERLAGLVENLITLGLDTTAKLIAFDTAAPVPSVAAAALNLKPGSPALRIERLRYYKSKPLSLTTLFLPAAFASRISEKELDDRPVMRILEATGIKAMRAEQTISAVAADDRAANRLSVGVGAPLIRLRRTVFDEAGQPFEHQQGLYNPDQYEYHMLLTRDNSSSRPQWRHIG